MGMFKPDVPETPDYAEATREGIYADIETLPIRKMIESAARRGAKVSYTDPATGEDKSVDFTGFGDLDQSAAFRDFEIESADIRAGAELDLSKKYGESFIKQRLKELETSDPEAFRLRKMLGQKVTDELEKGTELTDDQKAEVMEAERGAQAARGNILGSSSAAAEAMGVGDAGFRLWQQRLANAGAFLAGTSPVAQFGAITGAQGGATPNLGTNIVGGIGINQQAGQQGWQGRAQQWGMEFEAEKYKHAQNPFTKALEGVIGAGSTALGVYTGGLLGGK